MTSPSTPPGAARFRTTRWSLVVAAGAAEGSGGREALETLCRDNWFPLYAFARRGGASPADAADLVQGFFADLLEREGIADADPARGRFRTFLLAAFRHFASKEREKARAAKRGGGAVLSLDFGEGESRYLAEPVDGRTPEVLYERRWALSLLDRVLRDLEADYAGDREPLFRTLRPWLAGGDPPSHAAAAAALGLSEGAVKVALHRLRHRYRDRLRGAIAATVASPEEVEDEIRHLLGALGNGP